MGWWREWVNDRGGGTLRLLRFPPSLGVTSDQTTRLRHSSPPPPLFPNEGCFWKSIENEMSRKALKLIVCFMEIDAHCGTKSRDLGNTFCFPRQGNFPFHGPQHSMSVPISSI